MGIMGSDIVAATCIVAGGILGTLGRGSLEVGEATAPPAPECSGVAITTVSSPEALLRLEDGVRIVVTSRTPPGANLRIACGGSEASPRELGSRTLEARIRILGPRGELGPGDTRLPGLPPAPGSPR